MSQYMVIETFFPGQESAIYERLYKNGRMLPEGLVYLGSWLEKENNRCFQLMETENPAIFDQWINRWKDLAEFEVLELREKPSAPDTIKSEVNSPEAVVNYDGRIFRGKSNSPNGEVGSETEFHYQQNGNILTGKYLGGSIVSGQLMGNVNPDASLEFYYHHLNAEGKLMAGRCSSIPSKNAAGKLVLKEKWQWLTGNKSNGESEVEEV